LGFKQALGSASERGNDIRQTLGKCPAKASRIIAEKPADVEMELNR
jgi:hypothetical protein